MRASKPKGEAEATHPKSKSEAEATHPRVKVRLKPHIQE